MRYTEAVMIVNNGYDSDNYGVDSYAKNSIMPPILLLRRARHVTHNIFLLICVPLQSAHYVSNHYGIIS